MHKIKILLRFIIVVNLLVVTPAICLLLIIIAIPLAFIGGGLRETASLLREYRSSVQSVSIWVVNLVKNIKN